MTSDRERLLESPQPTVGLVIGTYGSVPYVHLQLESWRRNYAAIPVLVHDDGSPEEAALRALCGRYGADFSRNHEPYGHFAGDLTVFSAGLQWAQLKRRDLLVKFSRRFIPRLNWVPELQTLAYVTQYATYSNICEHFGYGFRTECTAMHVPAWIAAGTVEEMQRTAREVQMGHVFNEALVHQYARSIHRGNCLFNKLYETVHPATPGRDGYAPWPLLGTSRGRRLPHVLWHDAYVPFEYYLTAVSYDITDYAADAFESLGDASENAK